MRIRASFKNELTGLEAELDVEDDIPSGPVEEYFLRTCDLARVFSATLAEQVEGIVNQDSAQQRHQQLLDLVNSTERRCSARVGVVESKLSTFSNSQDQLREEIRRLGSNLGVAIVRIDDLRRSAIENGCIFEEWSKKVSDSFEKHSKEISEIRHTIDTRPIGFEGLQSRVDMLSSRVTGIEQSTPRSETPCRKKTNRKARKPVRAHRST